VRIDVVTIFAEYLAPLRESLLGRAIGAGLIELGVHDLRAFTTDRHRTVDDTPYGGGPGMVMKPDVWGRALDDLCTPATTLVVPTPAGERFTQAVAEELAATDHLVFACGRYEGIDQRVADEAAGRMTVRELSIGDYVLAGGEAAVLVMVEAIARLIPGVLGNPASAVQDSFGAGWPGLLEAPSYTRPETYRGIPVPPVLLSGNHAAIDTWRREQSLARTRSRRPDLLADQHAE
jgi:tRNA (guanine37-N1)-methyltransferase